MNCNASNSTVISISTRLMTPINYMDPYLSTIQIGFALIGIPMNLLVAGTIIFTSQLQTTHNIAWLGIGLSDIFSLFGFLVEVAAAREENPNFFQPLYNGLAGLPAACLVLNILLSFLERRLFFSFTSFYKKYVTNAWILATQITFFILISLAIKGRLFFQSVSLSLKFVLNEMDFALAFSILFIAVITLYIPYKQLQETKIDCCSKNLLATHRTVPDQTKNQKNIQIADSRTISEKSLTTNTTVNDKSEDQINYEKGSTFSITNENNHQEFSLSELQGYQSIKINVKAFLIFVTMPLVFLALSILCRLISLTDVVLFDSCLYWFGTTFYLRGIFVGFYTSIFNPLCFVGHSHDFVVLEQRCNPIGKISRATKRFIDYFHHNPNAHGAVSNV